MAIELSNITFTEQDDIVPASGIERILNTGIANTLAGNDIINGETGSTIYTVSPLHYGGIVNTGTLNTDGGNDRLTGIFNDQTSHFFTNYSINCGICNVKGFINTGDGNDTLTGILDIQNPDDPNDYYGIFNQNGIIDTGEGDDKIIGINNITNTFYTKSGLATPVMMAKKTALTCIFFQPPTQAEKFDRKAGG